jgi:hypothetical protein
MSDATVVLLTLCYDACSISNSRLHNTKNIRNITPQTRLMSSANFTTFLSFRLHAKQLQITLTYISYLDNYYANGMMFMNMCMCYA